MGQVGRKRWRILGAMLCLAAVVAAHACADDAPTSPDGGTTTADAGQANTGVFTLRGAVR